MSDLMENAWRKMQLEMEEIKMKSVYITSYGCIENIVEDLKAIKENIETSTLPKLGKKATYKRKDK